MYSRRLVRAWLCALIALMFAPQLLTHAQIAPGAILIDGSKIVATVIKQAAATYTAKHPDVKIDVQVSGTSGGFDKLCSGTLDINMAVSGITDQQDAACSAKNVKYVEALIGFDASVILVNNSSKITCVAAAEVTKLLSPTASSATKNWTQLATAEPDQPITTVYAATDSSRARDLMATLVPGNNLRSDISLQANASAVVDKIIAEPNSVGIVTLDDYQKATGKAVRALDIKNGTTCITPNVANLEEARYPTGEPLYLYVNIASLDRQPVADFVNSVLGTDGQNAVTANGFIAADTTSYTRDQSYLTAKQAGRTFSRIQSVNIPADTAGTITADGSPVISQILKDVTTAFQPRYTKITVTPTAFGNDEGFSKLCSGTVDMIGATRPPTADETASCKKNNIQTLPLTLGAQGVVLLVNAGNTFSTCLTLDEIGKLFSAPADGSASKVKTWSDVNSKFPATDLLILTPADGSSATQMILDDSVKGTIAPLPRRDTTSNDDPLYRAAGTANVAGAITYMTWTEYQKVTQKVTLVQVDAGKGCVTPSQATLLDSSYPLSETVSLVLNMNAFTRPEVKAFVWYVLGDDALAVLSDKSGLVGLDKAGFVAARDTVLARFAQPSAPTALGTAAVGTASATTNATSVVTSAATSAATSATMSATSAATALPVGTVSATALPTAVATQ